MSPAMASWASQQLKKMNGKDDLTLLEFCMSLSDASEIRQYLAAYLGSTPEVRLLFLSFFCPFLVFFVCLSFASVWCSLQVVGRGSRACDACVPVLFP